MRIQELITCDHCDEDFIVYEMKIFSEDDKDECSPFMEIKCLCNNCYNKHIDDEHSKERTTT